MAKRIELIVENAGDVDRTAWPITQGIPFADGELERGDPVRVVNAKGQILPTQSMCTAAWSKNLSYIKWLLVDFQADLASGAKETFFLEYGAGVEEARPEQGVSVERGDGYLSADTGTLRLRFRTPPAMPRPPVAEVSRSRDFLAGCQVRTEEGWHDVFRGNPGPYLYMVDEDGEIYDSCTSTPTPQVTVEAKGPMRACFCVKGYHASDKGIHLCPYALRIHVYAGKSDLKMFHTFVFDQEPSILRFDEVGMRFPLDLGRDLRMGFGGQDGAHWATRWEEGHFLQDSDLSYRVERDGEPFGEGEKTRGWATLCGSKASTFVALRDLWQQYPKGYRLTDQGIDVQFWPSEYGDPLVFTTPWTEDCVFFGGTRDEAEVKRLIEEKPTAPLNLKSFNVSTTEEVRWVEEMVDKYAPDRPASHNDTGTNDGLGAAKTHEFLLRFSTDPITDDDAETMGVCVQSPVIAPPDPHYMCGTRAARDLFGGEDPRFVELDGLLDRIVERVAIEPMERSRLWGFWRFGNMCCSHTAGSGLAYILHYDTDPVEGMRHVGPYNNEADDPCWGLWTQFMRTGRRDFFLAASGHSQAMGDVGICHANPSRHVPRLWAAAGFDKLIGEVECYHDYPHRDSKGIVHYHNAHEWSGGYSPSHTLNTTLFLHYYFTGNRRMYDIALEVADWAVRTQEPAGIISSRKEHGGWNREFTGPLVCLMEAYVATWMPKYGDLARRSLNWVLRVQEKVGTFPTRIFTAGAKGDKAVILPTDQPLSHGGTVYPIYYEGLRHFDSPLLRETILAEADHVIERGSGSHVTTACALAYEMTGDPIYAAMCMKAVLDYRKHGREIVAFQNASIFSGIRNGYLSVLKATAERALAKDPKGFAKAEERLLAAIKQAEPSGPETYQEKSIGIPEGYDEDVNRG